MQSLVLQQLNIILDTNIVNQCTIGMRHLELTPGTAAVTLCMKTLDFVHIAAARGAHVATARGVPRLPLSSLPSSCLVSGVKKFVKHITEYMLVL